jgi:hypothetical protein
LDHTSYPLLYVIAQQQELRIRRNAPKAELIAALTTAFSDLTALRARFDSLTSAERAVLDDLVRAGGRLPRYHVARRHGDFRDYRPWQPDAPARPWEAPISPTERLYFLGLCFYEKATGDLVIPAELLPHYPAPPPAPARATTLPQTAQPPAILHDIAQLLAQLAADPPRPAHGRWLAPTFLRTWGAACHTPPVHPDASSELRAPRRRFLHYLAAASGLIAPAGPVLALTPAAWAWLRRPPAARLTTLWAAFAQPDRAQWATFRLPGYRLRIPTILHAALLDELTRTAQTTEALGSAEAIAARLLARDPAPRNALGINAWQPEVTLTQALVALINGPLTVLGAVTGPADNLRLTAWGHHALQLRPAPDLPPPPPWTLTDELTYTPPGPYFDPLTLVTLASCGERQPGGAYRLTQATWVRALQRGYSPDDLLARLNAAAQRPLTGAEVATLNAWAATSDRMTIHRLTVLEVTDPAILARLQRTKRGRRLVLRTLARRAVVVDEGKLPILVRRLTTQEGVPPRVILPPNDPPPTDASTNDPLATSLGRGGAALLWMAARVYRDLDHVLPLPARLPDDLLDRLATAATPGDLAAAEAAAQRVHAALQDVIQGRAAFPQRRQPTLPVADSLAQIERAIAEGQALAMDYYTAGRDEVTHRVVEPYRVERRSTRRGDEAYLVGFCHRAQAERVFRIDRIRTLARVPLPATQPDDFEDPDIPWEF